MKQRVRLAKNGGGRNCFRSSRARPACVWQTGAKDSRPRATPAIMTLGALLFDVDGTLADTEPRGHLPAYNLAFRDFGLDWRWNLPLYRQLLAVAGGRERIAHYLRQYAPPLGSHDAAVRRDRDGWIDALHQCKTRHFCRRLAAGQLPLRAGIARLMREAAAANIRIAIVTNASRATLEPFLDHVLGAALCPLVGFTVTGDEVAHKKPAPDLYAAACAGLGYSPETCIAIEDSQTGVAAASAAGVPALVTINADTRRQCFAKALAVVDSLGEPTAPSIEIIKSPGFDFDYVDLDVLRRISALLQRPAGAARPRV